MTNRLSSCLFALAALAAGTGAFAQDAGKPGPTAEKAPSVIPAPRAEPVVPASPAKSIAAQLNDAYVSVFEHVAPAVVIIDVLKKPSVEGDGADAFPDFFRNPGGGNDDGKGNAGANAQLRRERPSEGSGFIIQASGFILTNNHVVANAEKITVRLKDGRQFPGRLAGTDEKTDIAVVKIEATDLPVAELADSDAVRVGQIACAIGVPYKMDFTFTTGVISAKGRNNLDIPTQDSYQDYLQTDASINPGNSGGPLVDLDGKVIGMNTLINGVNKGLGFAIPSNMLRETGDQLIHNGRVVRPYIGVRIVSISDDIPNRYGTVFNGVKKGVIVQTMIFDSPAFHSELHPADVITEVDGVPIGSDVELQKQIMGKKVGGTVQLSVIRRGKAIKVPVTTGELPVVVAGNANVNTEETSADAEAAKQETRELYGMQLQELTKDLASSLGLNTTSGVVVSDVAEDSPAGRANITRGDVIMSLDYKPVKDVASFKEAAKGADVKRGILCDIERAAGRTFEVIKAE